MINLLQITAWKGQSPVDRFEKALGDREFVLAEGLEDVWHMLISDMDLI